MQNTNSMDELILLSKDLLRNLHEESYMTEVRYQKYGLLKLQVFQPRESKIIVDKIDTVLSQQYGFTEEELDNIINYDIKYRMGIGTRGVNDDEN